MTKKTISKAVNSEKWILHLYISGMTPKSMEAIENIKNICKKYIKASCKLEIIDIYKNPEIVAQHHIIFSPSLIKESPLPKRTLIGTLSDTEKVTRLLGIITK